MDMEQAVLRKAQEEADAILEQARARAEARLERESARLREEHERRVEAMKAELEADLDREAGARCSEDRRKQLEAKNTLIEEVFAGAVEGVRSLPDDGYAGWLRKQLKRPGRMPDAMVVANAQDADLLARLLKELPPDAELVLSEKTAPIKGGFLVEGKQVDLDFSVAALLGMLRESLAEEIAAKLFADKDE